MVVRLATLRQERLDKSIQEVKVRDQDLVGAKSASWSVAMLFSSLYPPSFPRFLEEASLRWPLLGKILYCGDIDVGDSGNGGVAGVRRIQESLRGHDPTDPPSSFDALPCSRWTSRCTPKGRIRDAAPAHVPTRSSDCRDSVCSLGRQCWLPVQPEIQISQFPMVEVGIGILNSHFPSLIS